MAGRVKYLQEEQDQKYIDYEIILDRHLRSAEGTEKLAQMIQLGQYRYQLDLDHLRRENSKMVQDLIRRPTGLLRHMNETLIRMRDENFDISDSGNKKMTSLPQKQAIYRISFEGNLGRNYVTPRGLNAQLINNLVSVQGIVTKISLVRPKLLESYHYTKITGKGDKRTYWDNTDPQEDTNLNPNNIIPREDQEGNPMSTEFGYSTFRDVQTLTIQELPERTPTGQLPRSIDIILEDDLVDKAKPGDRIVVTGIYKSFATSVTRADGSFRSSLLATNLQNIQQDLNDQQILAEDVKFIEQISQKQDVLTYISKSIAPSIYGHDEIKKAILLLLIGGTEKNLSTGTHLRGDINMLLVGDPSTAKSQVLRYVMNLAPLAINTTGRGSSSVGLTASIRRDLETGENVLEAGAMVLADGGVVLIDEFDKMNEVDRVAIHEVMEQQTVTIAKAGIHCSLNARCSVIAAANPIYGEYQQDLPPTKNIGLPDSLLSRFDLLFIVLDQKFEDVDRKVAERVTKNHRYRGANDYQGQSGQQDSNIVTQPIQIKQETSNPFVQFQSNLYSNEQSNLLSQTFLKKYILYAKRKILTTKLNEDAIEELTQKWVNLRQMDLSDKLVRTLPITIRSLESMIRLASAHAKLRLSSEVTVDDCKIAYQLMTQALMINDTSNNHQNQQDIKINEEPLNEPIIIEQSTQRSKRLQAREQIQIQQQSNKQQSQQDIEKSTMQAMKKLKIDQEEEEINQLFSRERLGSTVVNDKQIKEVFQQLVQYKNSQKTDRMNRNLIWSLLQKNQDGKIKSYEEFVQCLIQLESRGKITFDLDKDIIELI